MQTNTKWITVAVLAVISVAALATAFWLQTTNQAPTVQSSLVNWKTYQNEAYAFSLQYPDLYTAAPGDNSAYPVGSSLLTDDSETAPVLASIKLDRSNYPNTNFAGAWVTMAIAPNQTASTCGIASDGTNNTPLEATQEFQNIVWSESGWTAEAAAGTKFEYRIFHSLRNSTCYEVALHLATSNIGNYDPGTVTAVDENALRAQLQSIFHTFQFTK